MILPKGVLPKGKGRITMERKEAGNLEKKGRPDVRSKPAHGMGSVFCYANFRPAYLAAASNPRDLVPPSRSRGGGARPARERQGLRPEPQLVRRLQWRLSRAPHSYLRCKIQTPCTCQGQVHRVDNLDSTNEWSLPHPLPLTRPSLIHPLPERPILFQRRDSLRG